MSHNEVLQWVERYEQAWRQGDVAAVDLLFSDDVQYRMSPYERSKVGHDAIKADWLDDEVFTMTASLVAVEQRTAVVRVEVHYGQPVRQEYRDLWVVHFADDGRVDDFEEWAYWPGRPFATGGSSA